MCSANSGNWTLRDIWLLQPDHARTKFLVTPYQERTPRFSPDGKWILYVSNDSGRDEIYVRPAADASTRITVSNDGGAEPVWARDGREVYYRNGDRLLAAPVQSFTPFAVGTPRVLFTTPLYERDRGAGAGNPNYDVARDGQRFVMIQAPTSSSNIVVVLNWFTELEERLKAGR